MPCTPLRTPAGVPLRVRSRHASRPFPSLSLASPMPHPEGFSGQTLTLRRTSAASRKVFAENCLGRPVQGVFLATCAARLSPGLSGRPVSGCRRLYRSNSPTSSFFRGIFALFCGFFAVPSQVADAEGAFFGTFLSLRGAEARLTWRGGRFTEAGLIVRPPGRWGGGAVSCPETFQAKAGSGGATRGAV